MTESVGIPYTYARRKGKLRRSNRCKEDKLEKNLIEEHKKIHCNYLLHSKEKTLLWMVWT